MYLKKDHGPTNPTSRAAFSASTQRTHLSEILSHRTQGNEEYNSINRTTWSSSISWNKHPGIPTHCVDKVSFLERFKTRSHPAPKDDLMIDRNRGGPDLMARLGQLLCNGSCLLVFGHLSTRGPILPAFMCPRCRTKYRFTCNLQILTVALQKRTYNNRSHDCVSCPLSSASFKYKKKKQTTNTCISKIKHFWVLVYSFLPYFETF